MKPYTLFQKRTYTVVGASKERGKRMDYIYLLCGFVCMAIAVVLQRYVCANHRHYQFLLPLSFAFLTFWIGFASLLFSFALIFVGQLCLPENPDQKHTHDSF